MKNYLIIIYGTTESEKAWAEFTPEQMQAGLKAYMDYTEHLVAKGAMIAGEGLSRNGAVLTNTTGSVTVTDGPYVFAKEMVGGFYFIKADSLAEATELAKGCPALHHGGRVEVREQMDY